ncbi:MAG: hypothetical protein AAF483_30025 [Planctomycetota bacterium]
MTWNKFRLTGYAVLGFCFLLSATVLFFREFQLIWPILLSGTLFKLWFMTDIVMITRQGRQNATACSGKTPRKKPRSATR